MAEVPHGSYGEPQFVQPEWGLSIDKAVTVFNTTNITENTVHNFTVPRYTRLSNLLQHLQPLGGPHPPSERET
jgi:hypothetical protein